MNKLLLTTALVAVSGAAVAEISWSGSAEFGYNSHVPGMFDWRDANGDFVSNADWNDAVDDSNASIGSKINGLYYDASLDATGTAELDNGVTASITYGINLNYAVDGDGGDVTLDDFPTVVIESSIATMTIGDVDHAAHDLFNDVGSMDVGFYETDGELVGRIDTTLAGQTVAASYQASNRFGEAPGMGLYNILTLAAAGEFASATYSAAYETGEFDVAPGDSDSYSIWGISAGYNFAGAKLTAAMTQGEVLDITARSIAIGAEYEMSNGVGLNGAISWNDGDLDDDIDQVMGYEIGASFNAMGADISVGFEDGNTDDDIDGVFTADASYDMGNGIVGYAGYDGGEANVIDGELADDDGAFYAGVEYALGNGAQLVLSHAQFDEAGDPEFKAGTTLAVTLDF